MKRHLPVLDDSFLDKIEIATPCSADWDAMTGDARVRHCGDCRMNVYNLSEMTRAEAAALVRANEKERTCIRLYRRPDGTLLTQDCWTRLRAARQRGWVAFAAALVLVCLTQLGVRAAAIKWLMQLEARQPPPPVMTTVEPTVATPVAEPIEMGQRVAPLPDQGEMVAPRPLAKPKKKAPPKPTVAPPTRAIMGGPVVSPD